MTPTRPIRRWTWPRCGKWPASSRSTQKYTVEKLGQETILGYKTQHVLVKEQDAGDGNGMTMEMWTAKDLLDYATFSKLQARRGQGGRRGGDGQGAKRRRTPTACR